MPWGRSHKFGQLDAMETGLGKDTSEDVYHHHALPVAPQPSSCWDDGRRAADEKPIMVLSS